MKSFDLVIIGGGSAGYAAARTAASEGVRTAIIEGARVMGGLCILRGCMPTKALLESSRRWHEIQRATEFGLEVRPMRPNFKKIMARKDFLIEDFASYRQQQLKKGRFKLIRGMASFVDASTIQVTTAHGTERIRSKTFILATGSEIQNPPVPGLLESRPLTSDTALRLKKLPKSLIVLGGGAIAVEFAQFFAHLGTKVTIIQRNPRLIRDFDPDVSEALRKALEKSGIAVFTGTTLQKISRSTKEKSVTFLHSGKTKTVRALEILHALGRQPALSSLGLEKAGIQLRQNAVRVNARMQSSVPTIFAAGDVTGLYEVVHLAIQQGEIAANNAVAIVQGKKPTQKFDDRLRTSVIFSDPEVAQVGLNEEEAKALKIPYRTAQYPFADHGKSMIHGATDGFVKLLADPKSGRLLGGSIIGPSASDLIHELIAVLYYRGTAKELAAMPHYHPTLAEIMTYPAEELAGM